MRVEPREYVEALFSPDEWDAVQRGLTELVQRHRDPIAARMLEVELPEAAMPASDARAVLPLVPAPAKKKGRKAKQPEPTEAQRAEAERIQSMRSSAPAALAGMTMEVE